YSSRGTHLMSRNCFPLLCVLLSALLFVAPAAAQSGQQASAVVDKAEAERWREDLRYIAEEMPRVHNNLFHTMTREQFEGAIRKLHERIPTLARHQIIVELARIAAMVGDGHTNVAPTRDPKIKFRGLPIKLYLFKDGLFVRAAEHEHASLLGARVLKIGNASVAEAVARAREIIGRDNEMDVKFFAPHLLSMPEVLHALGLIADMEAARFTLEQGGREREVVLRPVGDADLIPPDTDTTWVSKPGWVDMRDAASAPVPLWLKDPANIFWFEYLKDSRTIYVQLNQVGNKETETLSAFSKRLFDFIEANPVEKMVLDLRLNRGGNGSLLRPFLIGLIKSKVDQRGKLFAIMGRSTWSAAQFLLNDLEKYTNALFVGEPSGSKGNHYGDSRRITLPNSGLTVRVSVYYWQDWSPWDTRRWTAPHLTAELTSADYHANADPAMKLIQGYTTRKSLLETLNDALTEGGVELALKRFREFKAEPVNAYAATEEALLIAGQRLLNEKKPEQALALFKLDAEENPDSFRAYLALGEAYSRIGNKEQAVKNMKKALELNPKSYDAAESLRQLKSR
ncbi:MAG TPA: tetratricopeptide repeat protein, partial [Pyrinomonadaceae bacterium]|nr:tetratricopeptide repeat protein [Pyrinomonadaceae bacterium]